MLRYGLVWVFMFMLFVPQVHPQNRSESQYAAQRAAAEQETVVNVGADEMRARMQQQLMERTVAERQVQLRQDTEKLLALAAELKQRVDKSGPNILSLEVIKKAQEIEKLAKSVKDKMRDAY